MQAHRFFLCLRTPREAGLFLFGTGLTWLAASLMMGYKTVFAAAVALVLVSFFLFWYDRLTHEHAVDIWESQEMLMRASNQALPGTPRVTDGSLLYVALTLEELAETIEAFESTLRRSPGFGQPGSGVAHLAARLDTLRKVLHIESVTIRHEVARIGTFSMPMTRTEAVLALDGVTDTAVVVAGMGLASGLPVRAGYVEVADSNLSKRNPATFVIDKDPSGKWIKGKNYRPPNLEAVVEAYWPLDEELAGVTTAP